MGLRSSRCEAVLRQAILVALEVGDQHVAIGLPALAVAQRVELEHGVPAARPARSRMCGAQRDDLDVGHGLGRADQLDADLVELAQAALLRPLVAEHRPGIEEAQRQLLGQAAA